MEAVLRPHRHRITIQRTIETRNIVGEVVRDWQDVCQTWAEIKGDLVTIRYQPEIYPGDRVRIGNSYFEIVGVVDITEPTRIVRLTVKEFTGHGRSCLMRFRNEQQMLRAFPKPRVNTSAEETQA
jgi:head-tail adaptor